MGFMGIVYVFTSTVFVYIYIYIYISYQESIEKSILMNVCISFGVGPCICVYVNKCFGREGGVRGRE